MPPIVFVVPGRIDARSGGSIYDKRMAGALRDRGWLVDVRELDGAFPLPTQATLTRAARALADVAAGTIVLIDGLALGAMPAVVEREASRLRIVALVHLPLAAAVGLDRNTAAGLEAAERRSLSVAALVIVTGQATFPMLGPYGLPRDRVVVVEPGTNAAPLARGSVDSGPLQLLSVATLNPGKGHEVLLRALAVVPHTQWRLTCAGSLTRHPATVDRVRASLRRLGLEDRVSLAGELDDVALAACYDGADVFVLATLRETYGMAVAEALAHGLPVVSTTTGAIPDLVGDDAGLLVPPGNTTALVEALTHVIGQPDLRTRLAEGARLVRDRLQDWEQASRKMADALEQLATHG